MALPHLASVDSSGHDAVLAPSISPAEPSPASAVSWSAILAGAAGAAALSLILLVLGTGLGLSSMSPWTGTSAAAFGPSAILWVCVTQLLASGMGGYLAGRLRTRWAATPTDEVYFRDTAHGFLAWAVASLLTAALLTGAIASIVGRGAQALSMTVAAGPAAASRAEEAEQRVEASASYFTDVLMRAGTTASAGGDASRSSAEAGRILANALRLGSLPDDDRQYLGQLVAQRTGLAQADAERRASDTFSRAATRWKEIHATAREAADKARKASAKAALWLFVSLLIGAFVASLAATWGGRQRDH